MGISQFSQELLFQRHGWGVFNDSDKTASNPHVDWGVFYVYAMGWLRSCLRSCLLWAPSWILVQQKSLESLSDYCFCCIFLSVSVIAAAWSKHYLVFLLLFVLYQLTMWYNLPVASGNVIEMRIWADCCTLLDTTVLSGADLRWWGSHGS
jgi:hypothetical protein